MKSALLATVAALALWGAAAPASAATYSFSFTGNYEGGLGDGPYGPDDNPYGLGGDVTYQSTGSFVTANDGSPTSLTGSLILYGDNGSYDAGPVSLDLNRFLYPYDGFNSSSNFFFYLVANSGNYALGAPNDGGNAFVATYYAYGYTNYAETGSGPFTATLSTVPLPAALPLFGAALLGLGALGYGLKRNRKAAGTRSRSSARACGSHSLTQELAS